MAVEFPRRVLFFYGFPILGMPGMSISLSDLHHTKSQFRRAIIRCLKMKSSTFVI
jgi:hypothetical protein